MILPFLDKQAGCEGVETQDLDQALERWQQQLSWHSREFSQLFSQDETIQRARGYFHTLHEICQQPLTWL